MVLRVHLRSVPRAGRKEGLLSVVVKGEGPVLAPFLSWRW